MKKIQQEDQGKIKQIIGLCMDLQNLGYGDVFFTLSPHCELISVEGHKGGWARRVAPTFSMDGYYGESSIKLKKLSIDILIRYLDSKVEALSF